METNDKQNSNLNKFANIAIIIGLILMAIPAGLWLNEQYYQWSQGKKWQSLVSLYSDDSVRTLRVSGSNHDGGSGAGSGEDSQTSGANTPVWSPDLVDTGTIEPGTSVAFIEIPKLNLRLTVTEGVDWASLAKGPGHAPKTARIGDKGTTLISGHRTMYGAPFHDLHKLEIGDSVMLYTKKAMFVYTVEGIKRVYPTDWSDIKPGDTSRLVLSTCEPIFSAEKRLLILAELSSASKLRVVK